MYHKVFINNVQVVFSSKQEVGFERAPTFKTVALFLDWLHTKNHPAKSVCVVDEDEQLWQAFLKYHTLIEAAGGLVENEYNHLLVIKRLGFWDLPKGKLEVGESPEVGALREVEEECAIANLKIVGQLNETYHTYMFKGQPVLKKTYWFVMRCTGAQNLVPQTEEDITEATFMSQADVQQAVKNTYASLLPLFNAYLAGYK